MNILEEIKKADRILVAIGKGLETLHITGENVWDVCRENYLYQHNVSFYDNISKLLEGKDYFVATMCTDGRVFQSDINPLRIVSPCGNYKMLQCKCQDNLIAADEYYESGKVPKCDVCGCVMEPNLYGIENYNENGYLKQWRLYNIWLQKSLSKKLLVIELGMDYTLPNVLRWPLERVVFISNSAKMIRISEKFSQYPEELAGKVITVDAEPEKYIGDLYYGR